MRGRSPLTVAGAATDLVPDGYAAPCSLLIPLPLRARGTNVANGYASGGAGSIFGGAEIRVADREGLDADVERFEQLLGGGHQHFARDGFDIEGLRRVGDGGEADRDDATLLRRAQCAAGEIGVAAVIPPETLHLEGAFVQRLDFLHGHAGPDALRRDVAG